MTYGTRGDCHACMRPKGQCLSPPAECTLAWAVNSKASNTTGTRIAGGGNGKEAGPPGSAPPSNKLSKSQKRSAKRRAEQQEAAAVEHELERKEEAEGSTTIPPERTAPPTRNLKQVLSLETGGEDKGCGTSVSTDLLRTGERALPEGTCRTANGRASSTRLHESVGFLFGGGLALASAIGSSGLSEWIGALVADLEALPGWLMILVVMVVIVYLGELASNTAMAAVFLPVAGAAAIGMGESALTLALPVRLPPRSASCCPSPRRRTPSYSAPARSMPARCFGSARSSTSSRS